MTCVRSALREVVARVVVAGVALPLESPVVACAAALARPDAPLVTASRASESAAFACDVAESDVSYEPSWRMCCAVLMLVSMVVVEGEGARCCSLARASECRRKGALRLRQAGDSFQPEC